MQEALPYKTWTSFPVNRKDTNHGDSNIRAAIKGDMRHMVSENAVIVFSKRGCCMSHVVKHLLQGQGVNPAIYEIDEEDENRVIEELQRIDGNGDGLQFPAVFIGGQLFGGLDRIMATHITGELVPILKQARALWL